MQPMLKPAVWAFVGASLLGTGFFWVKMAEDSSKRAATNGLLGRLRKPTEPSLFDPTIDLINP